MNKLYIFIMTSIFGISGVFIAYGMSKAPAPSPVISVQYQTQNSWCSNANVWNTETVNDLCVNGTSNCISDCTEAINSKIKCDADTNSISNQDCW